MDEDLWMMSSTRLKFNEPIHGAEHFRDVGSHYTLTTRKIAATLVNAMYAVFICAAFSYFPFWTQYPLERSRTFAISQLIRQLNGSSQQIEQRLEFVFFPYIFFSVNIKRHRKVRSDLLRCFFFYGERERKWAKKYQVKLRKYEWFWIILG